MINVYLPPGQHDGTWAWQFQADRTYARPVHTLAYAGTILQDLFADIERFLRDGAGKYAAAGVAHRRGYLLYGPPGCGKTSLIRAIAAYFNLGLCILDLKGRSARFDAKCARRHCHCCRGRGPHVCRRRGRGDRDGDRD